MIGKSHPTNISIVFITLSGVGDVLYFGGMFVVESKHTGLIRLNVTSGQLLPMDLIQPGPVNELVAIGDDVYFIGSIQQAGKLVKQ